MALDQLALDADPVPALLAKANANFARLGLTGSGGPTQAADFIGQEYLDRDSGRIHVAKTLGSASPGDDWELKLRSGEKGAPLGCATLDAAGRVPVDQLPAALGGALNHAVSSGAPATLLSTVEAQVGVVGITPVHAASPVLLLARADLTKDGGSTARLATLTLRRGSDPAAPQVGTSSLTRSQPLASTQFGPLMVLAVDRPATTAAVTYGLFAKVGAGKSTLDRFELLAVELAGVVGPEGPAGADGRSLRSGAGAPGPAAGEEGDLYLDTQAAALYGPRTAGDWGLPTPLRGPAGPAGAPGPQGAAGATGAQGPAGPAGAAGPQGPAGAQGPAGPAGVTGPEGPSGVAGPVGPQGPQGPAGPPGPGGGTYAGQRQIAGSDAVGMADRAHLLRVAGADVTLTLDAGGFAELDWVEIRNENPGDPSGAGIVAITAGTDAINAAGRATILLAPGDTVRLVKVAATAPVWLTLSPIGFLALEANQQAAVNAAGTAQEARTDRHSFSVDLVDPAVDVSYGGFRAAWPCVLEAVHGRTRGGTMGLVVERNGAPVAGFAQPLTVSTAETSRVMGDVLDTGDFITYRLSSTDGLVADGQGLKGAYVTAVAVRIGD